MSTLVKTCGMFREEDIHAVNAARPDYCGFVIDYPRSHRSVDMQRARELRALLDPDIAAVGVFVDMEPQRVAEAAQACSLDAVQLHGNEDEGYLQTLRHYSDVRIIQAFTVRDERGLEAARRSSAHCVLLDSGKGTGETFDWNLLAGFERPYFLAGGLSADNIAQAIAALSPFAVDLSSGLETNRLKDPLKIAQAVAAVRACNENLQFERTGQ